MIIRGARQGDFPQIVALVRDELGYSELSYDAAIKRLERIAADPSHTTLVAVFDNSVIGFVGICKALSYELDDFLWILAFAVSRVYQGHGVGNALLAAVEAYARDNNISLIKLNCAFHRDLAHAFYESHGFIRKSFGFFKYL